MTSTSAAQQSRESLQQKSHICRFIDSLIKMFRGIALIAIFAAAGVLQVASGVFTFESDSDGLKCRGEPVKDDGRAQKYFQECLTEFKKSKSSKSEDEPAMKGKTCMALCISTKYGEFDKEGVINEKTMAKNIDDIFPAKMAKEINDELSKCAKTHNMAKVSLKEMDELCTPYKAYFNCSNVAVMKTCFEDFDAQIWNADD